MNEITNFTPFVKEYFEQIDFSYWEKRLNACLGKLKGLKTEKAKEPYYVDLYAIFCSSWRSFLLTA